MPASSRSAASAPATWPNVSVAKVSCRLFLANLAPELRIRLPILVPPNLFQNAYDFRKTKLCYGPRIYAWEIKVSKLFRGLPERVVLEPQVALFNMFNYQN